MGLNVKILSCNAKCQSCYENEIRKYRIEKIDMQSIMQTFQREMAKSNSPLIHGGEPLLIGKKNAMKLFSVMVDKNGRSGIQTNGTLIDDEWVGIFSEYKTNVGVSIDGDSFRLNRGRGTDVKLIMRNIYKMKMAGLSVSIISVLRKHNANRENIENFIAFLKRMANEFCIYYIRTNPGIGFSKSDMRREQLSNVELAYALKRISETCFSDKKYLWQPTRDVVEMMMGYNRATCVFNGCDVWATCSETPILSDGSLGNCMKGGGARDGIANLRAEKSNHARSEALFQIPMEKGGCANCEFWDYCHGGCPGEAEENDYRNKTRFCPAFIDFFSFIKSAIEGIMPSVFVGSEFPTVNLLKDGTTWRKEAIKTPKIKKHDFSLDIISNNRNNHGDREHGDSNDPEWKRNHPEWDKK